LCKDVANQAVAGIKPDMVCVTGDIVNPLVA